MSCGVECSIFGSLETDLGRLLLQVQGECLSALFFQDALEPAAEANTPLLRQAKSELRAYFAGKLRNFSIPLNPIGTAFQGAVWSALQEIPYGQVITYQELAKRLGKPQAVRAVGNANGRNPLPIFIPCHRVVAKNDIGGYSGGIENKKKLLQREGASLCG